MGYICKELKDFAEPGDVIVVAGGLIKNLPQREVIVTDDCEIESNGRKFGWNFWFEVYVPVMLKKKNGAIINYLKFYKDENNMF